MEFKSENELKQSGDIPVDDKPIEVTHTGWPPGPATGTEFEDPSKGSVWNVPDQNIPAHRRPSNLDPTVNGPFLDEIEAEKAAAESGSSNE